MPHADADRAARISKTSTTAAYSQHLRHVLRHEALLSPVAGAVLSPTQVALAGALCGGGGGEDVAAAAAFGLVARMLHVRPQWFEARQAVREYVHVENGEAAAVVVGDAAVDWLVGVGALVRAEGEEDLWQAARHSLTVKQLKDVLVLGFNQRPGNRTKEGLLQTLAECLPSKQKVSITSFFSPQQQPRNGGGGGGGGASSAALRKAFAAAKVGSLVRPSNDLVTLVHRCLIMHYASTSSGHYEVVIPDDVGGTTSSTQAAAAPYRNLHLSSYPGVQNLVLQTRFVVDVPEQHRVRLITTLPDLVALERAIDLRGTAWALLFPGDNSSPTLSPCAGVGSLDDERLSRDLLAVSSGACTACGVCLAKECIRLLQTAASPSCSPVVAAVSDLGSLCATWLEKAKQWKSACVLFEELLRLAPPAHRARAEWYNRLSLNYKSHLGEHAKARSTCVRALRDEHVPHDSLTEVLNRALALGVTARDLHGVDTLERFRLRDETCVRTVNVSPRDRHRPVTTTTTAGLSSGKKTRYWSEHHDGLEDAITVEDLARTHYEKVMGWQETLHAEGRPCRCLFTLLMWDQIFDASVPGAFLTSYQRAPLDLMSGNELFYRNRRGAIEARLGELRGMSSWRLGREVFRLWKDKCGFNVVGGPWRRVGVPPAAAAASAAAAAEEEEQSYALLVARLAACLGSGGVTALCEMYAKRYHVFRSGAPDLICFRYPASFRVGDEAWQTARFGGEGEADLDETGFACMFAEVKSKNDRLSHRQIHWLNALAEGGVAAELFQVKDEDQDQDRERGGGGGGGAQVHVQVIEVDDDDDDDVFEVVPGSRS